MADLSNIISQLERQRDAIDGALAALRDISEAPASTGRRGLPRKAEADAAPAAPQKRSLSPEGRKRIAEAARRRWAMKRAADAQKSAAPAKSKGKKRTAKKTAVKKSTGKKSASKKAAAKRAAGKSANPTEAGAAE